MPEYVYALHDFLPEHEDEVTFHAGERIEVVEKDDLYGDGWWQGRNLTGKVGLFPVSYTAPALPTTTTLLQSASSSSVNAAGTKSVLQPLHEENESDSPTGPNIVSPVPKAPATFLNGDGYESDVGNADDVSLTLASAADGEMMKATMTDVQKAIEQLGRGGAGGEDGDGARSFSFASTRDGGDTETDETDFDLSDLDAAADADGDDWHKHARRKLAAKARRAVEEAEKLEAMMAGNEGAGARRAVAPPIEVELSDESEAEDEGDFTKSSKFQRDHPYILEEDETEEVDSVIPAPSGEASATETRLSTSDVVVPPRDETEIMTATAATLSFPVFSPPAAATAPAPAPVEEERAERPTSPPRSSYPTPVSPPPLTVISTAPLVSTAAPDQKRNSAPGRDGLPSPSAFTHPNSAFTSKHNSMMSSSSAPAMTMPTPRSQQQQGLSPASELKKTHPSEWSLEQVVEWLKSKGFDQDVCDKFTEQEISGDVLLELDVNLLKSEIGIMAFGKRMRIANAITDLRRPPSIEYSDHHPSSEQPSPSPMQMHHSASISHTHSHAQSTSQSHHSFPGAIGVVAPGHAYSQSVQSSLHSPMYPGGPSVNGNGVGYGYGGGQFGTVQEKPTATNESVVMGGMAAGVAAASGVGLGIALSPTGKSRPGQLQFSPSDGALNESAARSVLAVPVNGEDEDRGHMSEGEVAPTTRSMRRRLFGRSHDSAASVVNSSRSKDSPMPSPTVRDTPDKELRDKDSGKGSSKESTKENIKESTLTKEKEKDGAARDSASIGSRHGRSKKSVDGGSKHGDNRLSIFAGTFGGTLGKGRKPPPSALSEDGLSERSSKFSLPRLHGAAMSMRKSSSNSHRRPSTPNASPKDIFALQDSPPPKGKYKEKEKEKETQKKDHATLRKRTTSMPNSPSGSGPANGTGGDTAGGGGGLETVNGFSGPIKQGHNILEQIGEPDHSGWMRKRGERYNTWKLRYFILKGPHLYCLRSNSKNETRIKGYIHIIGYKVTVDENVDPGRYGFRIDHDNDKTHYFSSEEKSIVRDWMKAIMKATIGRDYTKPVVSSCNIPTIPLVVAQAMNPAPRPPSPTARAATQKALRRENPDMLSSRDARVLMGLPGPDGKDERARADSFFSSDASTGNEAAAPLTPRRTSAPPRPSREMRRSNSVRTSTNVADDALIEWANTHLPEHLQIGDATDSVCGGLALLRLAESIKGKPSSPPVPDSAFPLDLNDDKLDGLFRLFDFLLDNDVKMGSVSINDVRLGKRDKIFQLLRALKAWEDKRRALANTIMKATSPGGSMVPLQVM